MGLVAFQGRRIGFWVAYRPEVVVEELPPAVAVHVFGQPVAEGRSLVLHAADDDDQPIWARVIHAPRGAALLCPWGELLLAAVGPVARFVDVEGKDHGGVDAGETEEFVSAWPTSEGMLLLGHTRLWLVDRALAVRWSRSFQADAVLHAREEAGSVALAVMRGEDWVEVRIELSSGEVRAA